MLERVVPAVVNISTRESITGPAGFRPNLGPGTFMDPESQSNQSTGSGVVVDKHLGYILTNLHVVEHARGITVTLHDKRRLKARFIGRDPETDIALLQIKDDDLVEIPMGDSDTLRVGDFVVAIGNPFGLGQSVTSGIVSALGRSGLGLEGYEDFIQTDASINPGSSGGALVNLRGELVGLNAAILAPSGGNVGIGFATPVNIARAVMQQLATQGSVHRGRLGITVKTVTPDLARRLGDEDLRGALVTRVEARSSGAAAGLKVGDVILSLDGRAVRGALDLRNRIGLTPIGNSVSLEVMRRGQRRTVKAAVSAATKRPASPRYGRYGWQFPFNMVQRPRGPRLYR